MPLIKQVNSWKEAFDEADALLAANQLTAVAVMSKSGHDSGKAFVATHLAEFGDPKMTLATLRGVSQRLYGEKRNIELWHEKHRYIRPDEMVDGWLLTLVFPD